MNTWTIISFNTGRMYNKNGQRIAATRVAKGIVFVDVDRNISGLIPDTGVQSLDRLTEQNVMSAYDLCKYEMNCHHQHEERACEAAAYAVQPITKE